MPKKKDSHPTDVTKLTKEIGELMAKEPALQDKLYRLQMEYDILKKPSEISKKA